MSIKEKLIHKLGGYTENERIIHKTEVIKNIQISHRQVVELADRFEYDPADEISDSWIHKELTYRLAEKVLENGLVEFHSEASVNQPRNRVWYAKIRIIEPFDRHFYR